jgi:hypothetical protein
VARPAQEAGSPRHVVSELTRRSFSPFPCDASCGPHILARRQVLPGATGFDGGTELAWCMPRGQLSSLIQRQTLDANDDVYALAA